MGSILDGIQAVKICPEFLNSGKILPDILNKLIKFLNDSFVLFFELSPFLQHIIEVSILKFHFVYELVFKFCQVVINGEF